jgi:opacity protein-like surface antigen
MVSAKIFGLAGAAALLSTATLAADLPPPLPPPVYRAPVDCCQGGWYLRGDVGVGIQRFQSFDFNQTNISSGAVWPATWNIDQKDIKDTFFIGAGIGYQWNNWLRFDFTGEYRADVKFKALGSYVNFASPGLGRAADLYDGDHSAVVLLANVYFDLGTWWCLTPFVGFGAGTAYHKTSALTDVGINTNGLGASAFGFANSDHTQWNFAWAAHAGVAYNVTNNVKIEFAYRYLSMGNVDTSEVLCGATGCGTGQGPRAFYTLHNFTSQDFKLGLRFLLSPPEPAPAYPLIRKG